MKRPAFRPAQFWQAALSTLPDASFFELMRSALGQIKTPYNKQKLIEDLSGFLSRPEIQEIIEAFIDDEDRRIIAAIALLGEPAPGEMESFFSLEYSFADLHGKLINLEERFIVYRFKEEGVFRLALNPKLEAVLAPAAADWKPLFETGKIAGDAETSPELTGPVLAAVLSFLLSGERFFRRKGEADYQEGLIPPLRKKITEEGERLFPGLDLAAIAGSFFVLGVFSVGDEYIEADAKKLAAFRNLGESAMREYLAAGIALYLQSREPSLSPLATYLGRSLVRRTAALIHKLNALAPDGSLPAKVKLAELLRREAGDAWNFSGELPKTELLIKAITIAGASVSKAAGKSAAAPGGASASGGASAAKAAPKTAKAKEGQIAFDSPFSFIVYPALSFGEALDLAVFSGVAETGTALRFTISRESVIRGLNLGYTSEGLWKLLEKLSGGRTDKTLKTNLDDWGKRYREAELYQGVVLSLSGERAYLAESGPLAPLVRKTLAPAAKGQCGIYLLNAPQKEEAAKALREAGVDIFAMPSQDGDAEDLFPELPEPEQILPKKAGAKAKAHDGEKAERIKEEFREALKNRAGTSKQEKDELDARINRRLIVSKSQLKDCSIRYEKLEARSLDYVGKTAMAKQAMAIGALLEVSWPGPEGLSKTLGIPEGLEKKGGETQLVLRPRGGGDLLRIPIGKISLLRRIKTSLFEG